jgi:hypothetical protein
MNKTLITATFLLLVLPLGGCRPPSDDASPQTKSSEKDVRTALVHEKELREYLNDERVLRMLKVKELIIISADVDRVVVGDKTTGKEVGEIYYTIQDRWHLKRSNERMEHKPGEGWLIWEQ